MQSIRFGGGEFITGPAPMVLQRLAALTTGQSRDYVVAMSGDYFAKSGNRDSSAIFLDGKDAEEARKVAGENYTAPGYSALKEYLDSIKFHQKSANVGASMVSPHSGDVIRCVCLKCQS